MHGDERRRAGNVEARPQGGPGQQQLRTALVLPNAADVAHNGGLVDGVKGSQQKLLASDFRSAGGA